jgi:hypothetical protein
VIEKLKAGEKPRKASNKVRGTLTVPRELRALAVELVDRLTRDEIETMQLFIAEERAKRESACAADCGERNGAGVVPTLG